MNKIHVNTFIMDKMKIVFSATKPCVRSK